MLVALHRERLVSTLESGNRDRSDIVKLGGPADVRAIFNRARHFDFGPPFAGDPWDDRPTLGPNDSRFPSAIPAGQRGGLVAHSDEEYPAKPARMLGSRPLSRTTAFAPRRDSRREKPLHQELPSLSVAWPNHNPKLPIFSISYPARFPLRPAFPCKTVEKPA